VLVVLARRQLPPWRSKSIGLVSLSLYKYMFQLLQIFQRYVASVSYRCCKSRSGYWICCTSYTTYDASIYFKCFICFSRHMLQVFLFGCCVCFTCMFTSIFVRILHMCCNVFSNILDVFISVSNACFKCFIFLLTHVPKVSSRSDVIHVAMWLTCHSRLLQLLGVVHAWGERKDGVLHGCGCWKRHGRSPPGAGVQQPWASVRRFGR
jgi:hypothetical protein